MGILPLQYKTGDTAASLQLDGSEQYSIDIANLQPNQKTITVTCTRVDHSIASFDALVCIYTPKEFEYYLNGGILQYVLRHLAR